MTPQLFPARTKSDVVAFADESFREVYGYCGLLCGNDRHLAERLVHDVYTGLARASARGELTTVSVGDARREARTIWIQHLHNTAIDTGLGAVEVSDPLVRLADLPPVERAVLVLTHVNEMPIDRITDELGLDEVTARRLHDQAIARLGMHR